MVDGVGGGKGSGEPEGGGPRGKAQRSGGPEAWGAQNFALFSVSRTHVHSFFLSLQGSSRVFFSLGVFSCLFVSLGRVFSYLFFSLWGVCSWNFGGVLVGPDPEMCAFSPSGCRVKAPQPKQAIAVTRRHLQGRRADDPTTDICG